MFQLKQLHYCGRGKCPIQQDVRWMKVCQCCKYSIRGSFIHPFKLKGMTIPGIDLLDALACVPFLLNAYNKGSHLYSISSCRENYRKVSHAWPVDLSATDRSPISEGCSSNKLLRPWQKIFRPVVIAVVCILRSRECMTHLSSFEMQLNGVDWRRQLESIVEVSPFYFMNLCNHPVLVHWIWHQHADKTLTCCWIIFLETLRLWVHISTIWSNKLSSNGWSR